MPKQRTSLSIAAETRKRGEGRSKELGYDSFSAYVEALIAADCDGGYSHYMVREGGVIRYGLKVFKNDPESDVSPAPDSSAKDPAKGVRNLAASLKGKASKAKGSK